MKMDSRKSIRVLCYIAILIFIVCAIWSIYIMYNRIGQVEGVLCGPGQYYYTDIPNWRDYFLKDYYHSNTPMIVLIGLFFIWGFIMYKVWVYLDTKIK